MSERDQAPAERPRSHWGWGYADNHLRYALLCQAAIGIGRGIFRPDVFHGHDWQAGLLPVYLKTNLAGDKQVKTGP